MEDGRTNYRILIAALKEIQKGEGACSGDRLTHATNAIENIQQIAKNALSGIGPKMSFQDKVRDEENLQQSEARVIALDHGRVSITSENMNYIYLTEGLYDGDIVTISHKAGGGTKIKILSR